MNTAQLAGARQEGGERGLAMRTFLEANRWADAALSPLKGDASFRRYIRLKRGDASAMLMDAPPEKENVTPYLRVARHLRAHGYSAPDIYGEDAAQGFLLSEDLGDDLFTRLLANPGGGASERVLYDAAVDLLIAWRVDGAMQRSSARQALALPEYDLKEYLREVSLFADWYLPEALGKEQATALREEYLALWSGLLAKAALPCECFVHRDYHADNLMWLPARSGVARVGLLDFQDALWGHPAYDLISLLEDARRDVPSELMQRAVKRYLAATGLEREAFLAACAMLAAQRNSKIIGIFVRLSRRDGKHGYLSLLPRVWRHLERDLSHPLLAELRAWMDRHVPAAARGALTVTA